MLATWSRYGLLGGPISTVLPGIATNETGSSPGRRTVTCRRAIGASPSSLVPKYTTEPTDSTMIPLWIIQTP